MVVEKAIAHTHIVTGLLAKISDLPRQHTTDKKTKKTSPQMSCATILHKSASSVSRGGRCLPNNHDCGPSFGILIVRRFSSRKSTANGL